MLAANWPDTVRSDVEAAEGLAVEGHPGALNQLLHQVLLNALQAQPDGARVHLQARS